MYIWLTISSCYSSIPLTLGLIERDGGYIYQKAHRKCCKNNTRFCDKEVPPENVNCSYIAVVVLDSVCKSLRETTNPQAFVEQCKYK